jgi:hypothetical protein
MSAATLDTEVAAAPTARAWWRNVRLWVSLAVVVALGAIAVGAVVNQPGRGLDINSADQNGSKALGVLLENYGARVEQTSDLDTALADGTHSAVVVTAPDEYSAMQLADLGRAARRLVLVRPDTHASAPFGPNLAPVLTVGGLLHPFCADRGAVAAGPAEWPGDTMRYTPGGSGLQPCYDNALLTAPQLAVIGSADILRNDNLDDHGVAALDVNAITDSRRLTSVVWLLPGADAGGPGKPSIWDLFPDGTVRVIWWAVAVGLLLMLWRARRLGGVVTEPLPVIVRAAELVQGHGRLYARAGARDRAARALRNATTDRLGRRLGLPRGAGAAEVAAAVAPLVGRPPGDVSALLTGPPPADDVGLVQLAEQLDRLEAAVSRERKGSSG